MGVHGDTSRPWAPCGESHVMQGRASFFPHLAKLLKLIYTQQVDGTGPDPHILQGLVAHLFAKCIRNI